MRCKVTNRAEALARGLKTLLATTDGDEEIFKSAFRFKSKAHGKLIEVMKDKVSLMLITLVSI